MNERLEKEIDSFIGNKVAFDSLQAINIAEHFYNLALADVRKELHFVFPNSSYDEGYNDSSHRILDFIDNLTK